MDNLYTPSSSSSSPSIRKQTRSTSLVHLSPSKSISRSGENDQGGTDDDISNDNHNVLGRLGTFKRAAQGDNLSPAGRYLVMSERSINSPLVDVTNRNMPQAARNIRDILPNNYDLTMEQISGTTFYIRVDDQTSKSSDNKIYRSIPLGSIDHSDNIFAACIHIWDDKLTGRKAPRFLAYLPAKLDGLTEFTTNGSSDIQDFMRLVKGEWDRAGAADALDIRVVLMLE